MFWKVCHCGCGHDHVIEVWVYVGCHRCVGM